MEHRPAGFWIRVAAALIDIIIISMAGQVLSYIFDEPHRNIDNSASANTFAFIYIVVCIIYLTASKYKGTPGKLILGLQVLTVDHERIGIGRSIGRFFAYYLSLIFFYIGFIMVAFTDEKKGLHDMICGTRVVYRK
ncbi:RDD family protein [Alkalicoccobacillus porphyridii]|uniref:RDD family protein n=1 Tax=Alkalicoccobacillus porphyridii TaxID=2597270 RepID=A0A553ZWV0_9BACI|nr:RDD family protein [Alkalicoccobacillus porphyridii]TSB45913.1 RDD family protein [Alkalicoccobacillus porphyridii]